jgi:hypothetical protein
MVPAASAYRFDGVPWPGGVVPYYNAAKDQSWAVDQAVSAWNRSGAKVRFVAVAPSDAKVVIRERTEPHKVYCSEGLATVGDVRGANVLIFPAQGLTHACNPYWAARVMTHELGHVLGLKHEDRVCATMNAYGNMRGGSQCPTELWAWRCRLLETDDIAGVAAIYGGTPKPQRANPYCPLYTATHAPAHATKLLEGAVIDLRFVRPAPPTIPSFVVPSPWPRKEGFVVSRPSPTCHAAAAQLPPTHPWYFWDVKVGARQSFEVDPERSSGCYAVWALDRLGRPSAHAALISFG